MPKAPKAKKPAAGRQGKKPKSTQVSTASSRQLKKPAYKSFRLSKRIRQPKAPLKGSFRLFAASVRLLRANWRLFGGISLVYLLLTVVLVKGFGSGLGLDELKTTFSDLGQVVTTLALFSVLVSSASTAASEVAGAYQSILLVVGSLAIIWALRQATAPKQASVRVKDAFYKGMYPLVPFLLVLLVVGLQLIPLLLVSLLHGLVFGGGLAVTALEQVLWAALLFCMALLSLYMVTSSTFALYIVTLPEVTPMQALRSARKIVLHRRFVIMRKVLFLPLALLSVLAVVMLPVIILSPTVAEWLFLVLSMLGLPLAHSYMYLLYRELIQE